jgi:hypothetical protein
MPARDLLIFIPGCNEPPAENAASLDTRNGHAVLDFDAATDESAVFAAAMPSDYAYGGLAVELQFALSTATTGYVTWRAAFERFGRGCQDLDAHGFADSRSAEDCPVPANCGSVAVARIEFADGAAIDYIGPGDPFRLKITRDAQNDTAAGDAEIYDRIEYCYNRQGEMLIKWDQNETVHWYEHDKLGRTTQDCATILGSGVDGHIRRIDRTYDVRGQVQTITSYTRPAVRTGDVVNEVAFLHNDLGLPIADYQSQGEEKGTFQFSWGRVIVTGAKSATRWGTGKDKWGTSHSEARITDGHTPEHAQEVTKERNPLPRLRLRRPMTTVVRKKRNPLSGRDLGRLEGPVSPAARLPAPRGRARHPQEIPAVSHFFPHRDSLEEIQARAQDAEYTRLGLGSFVQVDYTEPQVRYDLATGTGSDPYTGLDRFARVIDLLWRNCGTAEDVVRIRHGYDRAGNRLYREDPVALAHSVDMDEAYTYDGLYQLKTSTRGALNAAKNAIAARTFRQSWDFDATGDWSRFGEDRDSDGTWDFDQTRQHNAANEVVETSAAC